VAAAAVIARLSAGPLGVPGVVAVTVTLVCAVGVLHQSGRRYRSAHAALHSGRQLPDGRLVAAVAALTAVLCLLELASLLALRL